MKKYLFQYKKQITNHLKILSVAVANHESTNGEESMARLRLDGHLHEVLGWLPLLKAH